MLRELGVIIRTARKAQGWSQQQLADMAGIDRTTLGAIERNAGDVGLRKVARVLELLNKKLVVKNAGLPTLDDLQERSQHADE